MNRQVKPELLDELPDRDPRALRSRRDIGRLNSLMGNVGLMTTELRRVFVRHLAIRIAEIGSGGGDFMLRVARRLRGQWRGVEATLVDRQDVLKAAMPERFAAVGWQLHWAHTDALHWLRNSAATGVEGVVANLFLHQFNDPQLRTLLAAAADRAQVVIAVEPRRTPAALFFSRWLWLLGCNAVTRHDGPVSVRAGFNGRDISALWPDTENWELSERDANWFSHVFVAQRKEPAAAGIFQPIVSAVFDRSTSARKSAP